MIGAIVQARMSSTRLPGKVLLPLRGKPMLEFQLERLQRCRRLDRIGIATSTNPVNASILDLGKRLNLPTYAGSEEDVLDRYYEAAKRFGLSVIVRVTGDCPLIDPEIVDQLIERFLAEGAEYATNVDPKPSFPDGMDVEVVSWTALATAWREAKVPYQREHVTPFIRESAAFKKAFLKSSRDLSSLRLTVDSEEDYALVCQLVSVLPEGFHLNDVVDELLKRPDLVKLNDHLMRDIKYHEQKRAWENRPKDSGQAGL